MMLSIQSGIIPQRLTEYVLNRIENKVIKYRFIQATVTDLAKPRG